MSVREDTYFLLRSESYLGSWKDIFDMPTSLRQWFVERHKLQLDADKKALDK